VIATTPFVLLTVREFEELSATERAKYIQRLITETEARLEWSRRWLPRAKKPDNKRS
jgi:hypothetical protein